MPAKVSILLAVLIPLGATAAFAYPQAFDPERRMENRSSTLPCASSDPGHPTVPAAPHTFSVLLDHERRLILLPHITPLEHTRPVDEACRLDLDHLDID